MRQPFLFLPLLVSSLAAAPVPVIFDTDMGNDIDDALALSLLHALESRNECRILAVTLTNPAPNAAPFVHIFNTYYRRPGIPIGVSTAIRKEGADHKYLDAMVNSAPSALRNVPARFPPAPALLRRILAGSKEKVTLIQVGFSENLAALLESKGDEFSPLDGPALIREKVALLSIMAGDFATTKPEYNVRVNVPVAARLLRDWPGPVVVSGFEIGKALLYPAVSIQRDYNYTSWHPIPVAYTAYKTMPYNRETWDLTSVLYAVRPDAGYFDLSPPGSIEVDSKGTTVFTANPNGNRRHLILKPANEPRIVEAMTLLASQPPRQ